MFTLYTFIDLEKLPESALFGPLIFLLQANREACSPQGLYSVICLPRHRCGNKMLTLFA